jgi:hypothetical protein
MAKKAKKERVYTPEELEYKALKMEDIVKYCQENKQVKWLKDYALTKVQATDENKVPLFDEDGAPIMRKRTFIEIKLAFCDAFRPEIAPVRKSKDKGPSMYDLIASLEEEE